MRYVWVLVVACLVAATVVRPLNLEGRDSHEAQIARAPVVVVVVARREIVQTSELRLSPFMIAPAPGIAVPTVLADARMADLYRPVPECVGEVACARGPPSTRAPLVRSI